MPDRAARLLDPRWHWIAQARDRLYAELEPGAKVAALVLAVVNPDGTSMTYGIESNGEMTRLIFTDPGTLAAAAKETTIDATVRDGDTDR